MLETSTTTIDRIPSVPDIPGYKIISEIDQGGMATVYLALQERLERTVALKVMAPALVADKTFAERFLREGKIIARLSHPYIITLYELGNYRELYYLSMEFLPGGTLQQRIEQGLTLEYALEITKNIARALSYAHRQGIVHRDIKPHNILFRNDGSPVLTDFGIARFLDGSSQLTAPGMAMGSPLYMSPERVAGKRVDGRSDLYSLGIVLYQMLTSELPYKADDPIAVVLMHCTAPLPVLPKAFTSLQPILNKLLAKNPEFRFEDADQFIRALEAVEAKTSRRSYETEPVTASRDQPTDQGPLLPASRRRIASLIKKALIAATVLLAAVIAAYYLIQIQGLHLLMSEAQRRQQAEQFLTEAQTLYRQGQLEASDQRIAQGLALLPDHAGLRALEQQVREAQRAQAYERTREEEIQDLLGQASQQFEKQEFIKPEGHNAFESYQRVLKLDARNSKALEGLNSIGDAYVRLARQLFEQNRFQDSLNLVDEGLQKMPDHKGLQILRKEVQSAWDQRQKAGRLLAQAQQLYDKQRYEESLELIRQISELESDYPALSKLQEQVQGALHRQKEESALQSEIQRLLEQGQRQLKDSKLTLPKGDNAYESYQQVLSQDPGNSKAIAGLTAISNEYLKLAKQLQSQNKLADSLSNIERGLKVTPNHAELVALRKEVERALTDQEAKLRDKNEVDQSFARAVESFNQGRLKESLAWINEGLKLNPNHRGLRDLRDRVDRALTDQEAKLRDKNEVDQSFARAVEFLHQGKFDECLEQIKAGLKLDPNHRGLRELLVELEKAKAAQLDKEKKDTPATKSEQGEARIMGTF